MIAKLKTSFFIDAVTFEFENKSDSCMKAVLRDDKGCECSRLETTLEQDQKYFTWRGLNDLPYGVYTLELSQGADEAKMRLVKRI